MTPARTRLGVNSCIHSLGKMTDFFGNGSIFGNLGKQMKLRDEDKLLGRKEQYIKLMGKLSAKPGKQR